MAGLARVHGRDRHAVGIGDRLRVLEHAYTLEGPFHLVTGNGVTVHVFESERGELILACVVFGARQGERAGAPTDDVGRPLLELRLV